MIPEDVNDLKTVKKRLSYSLTVWKGRGNSTELSTHSTQEFVEEPNKITTRKANYEFYHIHGNDTSWQIHGAMKIITWRICSSQISRTSGDKSKVNHERMGRTWYGSIPLFLVYNELELIQVWSGFIPYVLVQDEHGLIQIRVNLNTS